MINVKYLIIGGGISGLTFANRINSSDYLIVEKEKELGGLCRTHYRGNYIWDYAGHFFHFANEELKRYFELSLNKDSIVNCEKNTKIFYKDLYVNYPFQTNIHQLHKQEFIECLYNLYFREKKDNYEDFLDMLYGKFGKSITEKFLKPYNEKLYACDLRELDKDAMGRFFPYAQFDDVISNMFDNCNLSYNTYFDYPKQGAQEVVNILNKKIDSANILLDSTVSNINLEKKEVKVNSECIKYEYLVNTISFKSFLELCRINKYRNVLTANQVLVFNIGFDKKTNISSYHWIYYPEKQYSFYRVGFYDNILSSQYGSLYVEIGYHEEKKFTNFELEKIFDKVLSDLKMAGIITNHQVVEYEALIINPGYIHITKVSNKIVKHLTTELAKDNVFCLGRYGMWTYCSMEDCMLQAIALSERIN